MNWNRRFFHSCGMRTGNQTTVAITTTKAIAEAVAVEVDRHPSKNYKMGSSCKRKNRRSTKCWRIMWQLYDTILREMVKEPDTWMMQKNKTSNSYHQDMRTNENRDMPTYNINVIEWERFQLKRRTLAIVCVWIGKWSTCYVQCVWSKTNRWEERMT